MRPPIWQSAAAFAARCHEHEKRDDQKTPYFSHPARVATTLCTLFGCNDEAALAAAYLHDTIEDRGVRYDHLEEEFGTEIADLVAALTKNMMLPSAKAERDYHQRLSQADWRARLVKLADQFDNYSDALAGKKKERRDVARKCRAALKLAHPDARKHPETAKGIRLLANLLTKSPR